MTVHTFNGQTIGQSGDSLPPLCNTLSLIYNSKQILDISLDHLVYLWVIQGVFFSQELSSCFQKSGMKKFQFMYVEPCLNSVINSTTFYFVWCVNFPVFLFFRESQVAMMQRICWIGKSTLKGLLGTEEIAFNTNRHGKTKYTIAMPAVLINSSGRLVTGITVILDKNRLYKWVWVLQTLSTIRCHLEVYYV